jgi:Asp/Glu/hydantoin racemase
MRPAARQAARDDLCSNDAEQSFGRELEPMMSEGRPRIRVVNPNSNEAVTRGLDEALRPMRFQDGPEIVCSTLAEGPFGIENQADVESVVLPLRRLVETDNASDAFIIACFSDPGLHVCREGTARPVFGIAECGVLAALACADRFGVIAISARSIARHQRYLRQMGLTDRFAGERPLEMTVAETTGAKTLDRMIEIGRALRDQDGAEAVIMGCAGMARHRRPLEAALGVPVIDPTQAAVTLAFGAVQFARQ